MKYILLFFLVSISLFSCRTKHDCPLENIKANFIGYDSTEIDTLNIFRYQQESNFSIPIDTIVITKYYFFDKHHDTTAVSLPNVESVDNSYKYLSYDIKILNPFDNKIFSISEVNHSIETFSEGFSMDHFAPHCVSTLTDFKFENVIISNSNQVFITK